MKIKIILLIMLANIMIINANSFKKLKTPVKAVNIILQNSEDNIIDMSKIKNKTIILNFWASWCPPCKREMPSLQKFYSKYKNKIEVLAVASGQGEDDVFPFISKMNPEPTFNILYDVNQIASINYNIQAMPTSFIIKDGFITHYAVGEIDFMEDNFLKLIK